MALRYDSLDDESRKHMLSELERDMKIGSLYLSDRLSIEGNAVWPLLLKQALTTGTDRTLDIDMSHPSKWVDFEQGIRNGVPYRRKLPTNASTTLAEGEFNHFYLRGICLRGIELGRNIEIYRGRQSLNPRPESNALIGAILDPIEMLADLRCRGEAPTTLRMPSPNSGLTGRIQV